MVAAREYMLAMREEDFFVVQDALVQHIGAARALCYTPTEPPFALGRNTDVVHSLQMLRCTSACTIIHRRTCGVAFI